MDRSVSCKKKNKKKKQVFQVYYFYIGLLKTVYFMKIF